MNQEPNIIHHYTKFEQLETGLDESQLAFPEYEQVLRDYLLSQPRETMEFKNGRVSEQEDGSRTVHTEFHDHNGGNLIRLWGTKTAEGNVSEMVVDAVNVETKELMYERKLA
ncbi:hypothetical protein LCM20_16790 [Halobacillus litoralis]|uniref:hypothetical protein n=1 Tax=Halobacillus litoralis TaxID=45668 RepID=UPI001CD4F636|nr:hypothetical protein [Halobacillus litoralis]MCA0972268.1 hypothetical protein [Halobacillus litoralis]